MMFEVHALEASRASRQRLVERHAAGAAQIRWQQATHFAAPISSSSVPSASDFTAARNSG